MFPGACVFAGRFIHLLPVAILFGVFLYLALINLFDIQFIERLMLVVMPQKYFPNKSFCQKVLCLFLAFLTKQIRLRKLHLFTGIQVLCLIGVYLVKHFTQTALLFPFVLMLLTVLRHFLLPLMFTQDELHKVGGDKN